MDLNDVLLIVHRSIFKSNGQHSPLEEPTTSHLYQPPLIPTGGAPQQTFSLVSHQRHPLQPSYPSYQHPIPPPLHPAPPPRPLNGLHPPTASAGIPPFQQYPPPMAPHGNGNGIIHPPQPPSGNLMHNAPPPPPSAHTNSNNNLDIGALNHTIHLLQQVIQQQQSAQKSINLQEHNATLASIQHTLSSLMLSQQQQPSQRESATASPSNILQQMASQLSALAAAAANGSPSSIPPPPPQSVDYPYSGYPPPPTSMHQQSRHGPVLTSLPTYNTSSSPSPTSPQYPTDPYSMIPSVNELLGKIKDLSKQVIPPPPSSRSTRNPRRRT